MHFFSFLGIGNGEDGYDETNFSCSIPSRDQELVVENIRFVQTAVVKSILEQEGVCQNELKVTLFGTEAAKDKNFAPEDDSAHIRREFDENGIEVTPKFVEVGSTFDQEGVRQLFTTLKETLEPESDSDRKKELESVDDEGEELSLPVVFDVTHGFRVQPAIGLLALSYLKEVHPEIEVWGLTYGDYMKNRKVNPVVDFSDLWTLTDWAGGFRLFQEVGDLSRLADLADDKNDEFMREHGRELGVEERPQIGELAATLRKWQERVEVNNVPKLYDGGGLSGLVEEIERMGDQWNEISRQVGEFIEPLREEFVQEVRRWEANSYRTLKGAEGQINLVDWLKDHRQYQHALTLARELSVSLLQIPVYSGSTFVSRKVASKSFGQLRKYSEEGSEEGEETIGPTGLWKSFLENNSLEFGNVFDRIGALRNQVNHACIEMDGEDRAPNNIRSVLKQKVVPGLRALVKELEASDVSSRRYMRRGRTLLTSLGSSPGTVFTAIRRCEPDAVGVLTSEGGRGELTHVLEEAKAAMSGLDELRVGDSVKVWEVEQPKVGFQESKRAAREMLGEMYAQEVVVNLAGGTTAMQSALYPLREDPNVELKAAIETSSDPAPGRKWPLGEMRLVEGEPDEE